MHAKFFNSDELASHYKNGLFVGDANTGSLYHFDINENTTELELRGFLEDKIADMIEEIKDFIFVNCFDRITDLEIAPDDFLYVLSSQDEDAVLYKISKAGLKVNNVIFE
jgi:glucose/arabinose dehydrogenase